MEDILTTLRRLKEQEDISSKEEQKDERVYYKDLIEKLLNEQGKNPASSEIDEIWKELKFRYSDIHLFKSGENYSLIKDDKIDEGGFRKILRDDNKTIIDFVKWTLKFRNLNVGTRYKKEFDKNTDENVRRFFIQINKQFEENPSTNPVILFLWREKIYRAFGFKVNEKGETTIADVVNDLNFIEYFFNHHKLLTNTQAFWIVFDRVFRWSDLNNIYQEQWLDCFLNYERLDGLFLDRIKLAKGDYIYSKVRQQFMNTNLEDDIKIYRGFLTREGRFVRKGITKLNNPDAEKQDEGTGLSYSLSKPSAAFFAYRYHFLSDLLIQQKIPSIFGNVTEQQYREKLLRIFGDKLDESFINSKARQTLCSYTIKKKDIIWTCGDVMVEKEVIADPNKVKLVRYDFLNEKTSKELGEERLKENSQIQDEYEKLCDEEVRKFPIPDNIREEFKQMFPKSS
tara:strand:- start:3595 stop:4956 length:1362 start_codon:yes stop_codon:yes gene_type:complete